MSVYCGNAIYFFAEKMRLSILISSIPSRFDKAITLYHELLAMCEGLDIEILMLTDNKQRTIGEKREALKNIANGKYFMFVDDDDSLLSVKEIYEATENDVDVITFKQWCYNDDGSTYTVTFGLGNEIEHNTENGNYKDCKRPPFHVCAWHQRFKAFEFPAINYGEDAVWVEEALKVAEKEFHIDKVIHSYNFNSNISEATTETNEHWKNPNEFKVFVNFSTKEFAAGQKRLIKSLPNDHLKIYDNYSKIGSPTHQQNPYAFKIYAIEKARNEGATHVFWLDSSVYAVKDITPVWEWLHDKGIFLEEAGHLVGNWCNDFKLNYFGITREQAMQMPMFAAGYVGFDFTKKVSIEFFERWKQAMLDGCFNGSWENDRHDMTCGSIIAYQMGLVNLYSPGGQFFAYVGEGYTAPKETAVFHLQGL